MIGRKRKTTTAGRIQLYHGCDAVSGVLLLGMAMFSPWAFGTTEPWSIWMMTCGGLMLGLLFLVKLWVRETGYRPARWDAVPSASEATSTPPGWLGPRGWILALGAVVALFLGLVFVSAWNARARYDTAGLYFEYRETIAWLPSSLERGSTWFAFWQYLGLAAGFWAVRDWLLGLSAGEWRARHGRAPGSSAGLGRGQAPLLPARLRWLLWVICLNGALVGLEGIAQRLEGSGRLLFLVQPEVNPAAVTQFGPWAYRANAAQFFNLSWPVALGFWWIWQRGGGARRGAHHLLLAAGVIMASCPLISTSRGGAMITFGMMAVGALGWVGSILFWSRPAGWQPARRWATLGLIALFYGVGLWLGLKLGWPALEPRMSDFRLGLELREQMFDTARPMASDYPWFGMGAGTFGKVFQLYRGTYETYWPAELHNDWLELRITLGWVGLGLLLFALLLVWIRWWLPGGIRGGRRLAWSLWLGQAGCLVHARWDFPFQIHSIVFLFVLWTAVLSCLSRR